MGEEKKYINILFSEEKYLNELSSIYNNIVKVRRFKRKMDDIDKEITWFAGNKKTMYTPDYTGFYTYAQHNYMMEQEEAIVHSYYKELLGDFNAEAIPAFLYCLVLMWHFKEEEDAFAKEHTEDYKELSKEKINEFRILHSKFKLLFGFFKKIDPIIAVFINSIDMQNIEYLDDDIKNLDSRAVKHRFMAALQKRDKNMAFKLLGRMRELDEGEDYYFEALSHYINDEYDEAVRYIDKIKKNDIDYASATALKLECFSLMGDSYAFIKCISDNMEMTFEFWNIEYLMMQLILRLDISKEKHTDLDIKLFEKIKFSKEETSYYIGMTYRLVANILVEGTEIIETVIELSDTVKDFDMPPEKVLRLELLSMALELFPEDYSKYLDIDHIEKDTFKSQKNEMEMKLMKLLIDDNPDYTFENLHIAFLTQLKLGDTKPFINNVVSNFEALLKYEQSGETGAEELIRLAYIESAACGEINEKIKEHVEKDKEVDLTENITDRKIMNILSKQGRLAYKSAEWQYRKSEENEYGWRDAGMISLGFYRILEVELNKKFVIPLLSCIGYDALNAEFGSCTNALIGDDKRRYKIKWGTIIKTYKEMEETQFAENGFMLGVLDHFIKAIGSEYDENDALAELIKSKLCVVLNSNGILEFKNGFFEKITNEETRNKYRNPPAHTRYLPYSVACECRDIFRKTILKLGDMLIQLPPEMNVDSMD